VQDEVQNPYPTLTLSTEPPIKPNIAPMVINENPVPLAGYRAY